MVDDAADFLQVPKSEIMAITEVKAASLSRWTREGQMLPLGAGQRRRGGAVVEYAGAGPGQRQALVAAAV
ncbi:hypothetical protein G6F60_015479 [Rhizopus arrhizus]|nr:hypothetical protein G6F60_015479 [Rhizopus arrhizus]